MLEMHNVSVFDIWMTIFLVYKGMQEVFWDGEASFVDYGRD